jgi:hypothetical protein
MASSSKARLKVYEYTPGLAQRALIAVFEVINKFIPWHKLPTYVGVINLAAFRYQLRQKNLHDTYPSSSDQGTSGCPHLSDEQYLHTRHSDGLFNDLSAPKMGCAGMRFGRNVPREHTTRPSDEDIMTPNPRLISEELLQRDTFKPATSLNLLAAAWIQFQVHDWFQHVNSTTEKFIVSLPEGDEWTAADGKMTIERTQADTPLDEMDKVAPAYKSENTHWWDGSQIYGSSEARTTELRGKAKNGKLATDQQGLVTFLPRDAEGMPQTGFNTNWWLGLEMLHTLFVLEHNAICDELLKAYPDWSSEELFDTARLVNCALMAKIHTVEWTPAILAHPALKISMEANWWGVLGERLYKLLGRVSKTSEAISGIPGSTVDHHAAPYSLTEEFVSVYRMHALIPDEIAFFSSKTGDHTVTHTIADVAFEKARNPLLNNGLDFSDIFYSFGINHPGALTLNNTPNFLRDLHTPDNRHIDLSTIDILRDRERGVPRYNAFRQLFHLPTVPSFLALTGNNAALAKKISALYDDDIEAVDLLIGCLAEPLPQGFGFSDTAFRVFILMASRRLKSDRFIAGEWNEETYSKVGLKWVQDNEMKDVLGRHFPLLKDVLGGSGNAFAPWVEVKDGGKK